MWPDAVAGERTPAAGELDPDGDGGLAGGFDAALPTSGRGAPAEVSPVCAAAIVHHARQPRSTREARAFHGVNDSHREVAERPERGANIGLEKTAAGEEFIGSAVGGLFRPQREPSAEDRVIGA